MEAELSSIEDRTSASMVLPHRQLASDGTKNFATTSDLTIACGRLRGFINKCDCTHGNGNDFI